MPILTLPFLVMLQQPLPPLVRPPKLLTHNRGPMVLAFQAEYCSRRLPTSVLVSACLALMCAFSCSVAKFLHLPRILQKRKWMLTVKRERLHYPGYIYSLEILAFLLMLVLSLLLKSMLPPLASLLILANVLATFDTSLSKLFLLRLLIMNALLYFAPLGLHETKPINSSNASLFLPSQNTELLSYGSLIRHLSTCPQHWSSRS
jgi:hypothetical protein